jgi:hypothetical protein
MSTTWTRAEAETAFGRVHRARRRATFICRVRTLSLCSSRLAVHDQPAVQRSGAPKRQEIPLAAITATLEPNRAEHFDGGFRPAPPARCRWLRIWLAERSGAVLPPISVVRVGATYAVRDGHHRVSVARARGAVSIDAIVAA